MRLLDTIAQARRQADVGLLVAAVPYAAFIGLEAELSDGRLVTRLPFAARNLGNPDLPALHGGVVAAFLELTGAFELLWAIDSVTLPRTINITVDYLRPARAETLHAHGIITKLGRQVVNVRIEAWHQSPEKPVAHGHAHFLIAPPDENHSA
jgi:uncharacterized protein (TIGR00369 family)